MNVCPARQGLRRDFCSFPTKMRLSCVFCGRKLIQTSSQFRHTTRGISCSVCGKFSCRKCLKLIVSKAINEDLWDDWCAEVMLCLNNSGPMNHFIGHCCELRFHSTPVSKTSYSQRFDGYLVLPEYQLMINPNFSGVDVHALGRDADNQLLDVWHAVVDEQTAIECEELNIVPNKSGAKLCDVYSHEVRWNDSLCSVNIMVFQQSVCFDGPKNKGCHPKPSDLQDMFMINEETMSKFFLIPSPLLLVIGLSQSAFMHCLLLRCSEMPKVGNLVSPHPGTDKCLFQHISKICGKKGLEVNRRGGSSGLAAVTPQLLSLATSGFFPKDQSGLKLFQNKLTWTGVYLNGNSGALTAKSWTYGQPRIGGSFKMKKDILKKSIAMQQFVLFKMQAADILVSVSSLISPSAVRYQLEQNRMAKKLFHEDINQVCHVSSLNNYTVVQHAVGYHKDTFKGRQPILENKICFAEPTIENCTGRGGCGSRAFVWSLLDW